MHRLHLDFETASEINLKTAGTYRYAADPSTRVLMLGWAVNDEPVGLWQPHLGPMPERLRAFLLDPGTIKFAFNAAFERLITKYVLGIEIPYRLWRCTMVEAFYLGFAGGLDTVLKAVGLQEKDAKGKRLINLFSSPAPRNHKAGWYDWDNRPEDWALFCQYCIQDVIVERQLHLWMMQFPQMPQWDWEQWFLDQKINDRGVPMDVDMADAALEVWDQEKRSLTEKLAEMTGLPKVTRDPFKEWISEQFDFELDNLRKDYLDSLLSKKTLPEIAAPYIRLWQQKEGKAVSKYARVRSAAGAGDRARGMFQYKGAARTDRVGGRLIQLQNLKRPLGEKISTLVDAIKLRNAEFLGMLYPYSVSEILGGSIRHVIHAPMAIADLSSIESVVLGWIAQCPAIDDTFRAGRDSYKEFASRYYDIDYADVTKEQRGFSKPPVLGCGYMLGWKGLIAYAEGYGVEMTKEQARSAVETFRGMYPEIPDFWDWIYKAVKHVTMSGMPLEGYRLKIERDADFLRIWLPSGRALSYYKPEVRKKQAPWRNMIGDLDYDEHIAEGWTDEGLIEAGLMKPIQILDNFCYMGMSDTNQWVRVFSHAGKITENVVQSIAGDILWHGITNADKANLDVILHVHDEIAVETTNEADLKTLEACMTHVPDWADGLWLGADGFLTDRYTKD